MHVLSIFRKLNTVIVLNDATAKIIAVFFLSKCKRHVHIHIRICCVPMLLALPVCKMVTMVAMPCQAILCLMLFGIFFSSFLLLFECVSISFFFALRDANTNLINYASIWRSMITIFVISIFFILLFSKF